MLKSLDQTLALLASLQKERGYALRAIPLGSLEALASFEMQSTMTSLALEALQKTTASLFDRFMPQRFFDAMKLRNNESFRASQPLEALAEWYVFNLEHPIHQITVAELTEDSRLSPVQISALVHNLSSIAALSHLRDAGLMVYARAEISAKDIGKMKSIASYCLTRERLFLGLADEITKKILNEVELASSNALSEADEILQKIKEGQAKALLAETPLPVWFEQLDQEIDSRHETLQKIIARLANENAEMAQLHAPRQALDGDVEQALPILEALPLFKGLAESSLRNVLKGARFLILEKNATLLTQGETTSRFYIVMEGWAKVFKTTADAEESVLQILGRRDCVLDNPFLSSGLSNIGVKTVTKARILSLSLPVLRDTLSRDRELAQNLLTALSGRLQRFVMQFEQITLRTAIERVGWFFANLNLETGLEGAPLTLPYDKALIAAYLNIKPETFSRVLQHFRQNGFKINKHQIVMPNPQALCAYCDPEMALRCCRAEAMRCAPILAARRSERK